MQVLGLDAHIVDPRFATYASRKVHEAPLVALVEPAVRTREAVELEAALVEAGIPCARVNNFKEVFDDPHIVARGVVGDIEHPRLGKMKAVRNPVLLDHDGPDVHRHSPVLGEHSEEILRELGYAPVAIAELVAAGATRLGPGARSIAAAE
jgi:crotonobetainyl-CoA:carnitine CoA-transferase CaiB-like acyl-CoA transferase